MLLNHTHGTSRGPKVTNFWRIPIAMLLLLCSGAGFTSDAFQSTGSIETAVREVTGARATSHGYENVTVEVRRLDTRLRLAQCTQALDARVPPGSAVLGAVSVAVSCQDESPWTIYVRSHISAMQSVPVLNKPLARHAILTEDDLNVVKQPLGQASSGTVFKVEQLVGMQLTRALDAGADALVRGTAAGVAVHVVVNLVEIHDTLIVASAVIDSIEDFVSIRLVHEYIVAKHNAFIAVCDCIHFIAVTSGVSADIYVLVHHIVVSKYRVDTGNLVVFS